MNKLRYRLVFNKARGICMAVQETARSQGKGPGQSGALDGVAPSSWSHPALHRLVLLLGAAFGSLALVPLAAAQIIADPKAPGQQRATVLNAANGVLQVNVQTPSAAGVSRNVYSQFDVPKTGAILNNSRTNVQTQLGGWVQANPWMTDGTARVILNEVNSSNPSRLQGYIEVAGQRAETIIANPAGIAVDGGGFINVSRATLTTGSPIMVDGALKGYAVQRGQIVVDGAGLDASSTDYTALIARSVQVNASLWAQRLNVITGVNDVDEQETAQVAQAHQGAADVPSYAIDVARLGGMYANRIWLVGTEAGVGVRNAGEIGAGAGDLVVTASGRLENAGSLAASGALQATAGAFDNHGKAQAGGDLAVTAASLVNTGKLTSGGAAVLGLQGDADNRGGTIEAQRIALTAGGAVLNAQGTIAQTGASILAVDAAEVLNAGGTLGLAAPAPVPATSTGSTATNGPTDGTTASTGTTGTGTNATPVTDGTATTAPTDQATTPAPVLADGTLAAQRIDNAAGTITSTGGVSLHTGSFANTSGSATLRALAIDGTLDNRQGKLDVLGDAQVRGARLANDGGKLLVGGTLAATVDAVTNAAGLVQAGMLHADVAQGFDNAGGIVRQTGTGTASVTVGGTLAQQQGTLDVGAGLTLRAGAIAGTGSTVNVTGDLRLDSGATSAVEGKWTIGGNATLHTGDLDNGHGAISAGGALALDGGAIHNASGRIAAGTNAAIAAAGNVANDTGVIQAGGSLSLRTVGTLRNDAGAVETLDGTGTLDVTAAAIENGSGRIANAGTGAMHVQADTIGNAGLVGGNGSVAVNARAVDNATAGRIVSGEGMTMTIGGALDNGGRIAAGSTLVVDAATAAVTNRGTMLAQRDAAIAARTMDNAGGTIATAAGGAGNIALATDTLDNSGGLIQADAAGRITVRDTVDNADGAIRTGADLKLNAGGRIGNEHGAIAAGTELALAGRTIVNEAGTITAAGMGQSIVAARDSILNSGTIAGNGALAVHADALENAGNGNINALEHLDLGVRTRLTNDGSIASAGTLAFDEAGAALRNRGTIATRGDAAINIDTVDNDGGRINVLAGGLQMTANDMRNRAGQVMASGDATLTVHGNVDNAAGIVQAGGALGLRADGALNNTSGVVEAIGAASTLRVDAASIDNTAGRIANTGNGASSVRATGTITNSGVIAGNGTLDVAAATLANSGTVASQGALGLAVHDTLTNTGAISSASTLHMNEPGAAITNRGAIVAAGTLEVTAKTIDNGAGTIATARDSHADVLLSAQNISNQGGAIMADRNAAFLVKDGVDNRTGLLQAREALALTAGGTVDNGAGTVETLAPASTLAVTAGSVLNEAGQIVNAGTGDTAVRAHDSVVNSGRIAGNGALALEAQTAVNQAAGTIAAGTGLALQVHGSLDNLGTISSRAALVMDEAAAALTNRGTIVAGGGADVRAGAIDNDGGTIAAARDSGTSIALRGDSLSNRGGTIVAENGMTVAMTGALDNTHGLIQGVNALRATAGGTLTNDGGNIEATGSQATLAVQAGALSNDAAGRIVNVGQGAASVTSSSSFVNGGTVAGNGTLDVAAQALVNKAGATIASAGAMTATIGASMDNAGTVNAGGTLALAAQEAQVRNNGLVVAGGALTMHSAAFDNDGGRFATAQGSNAGIAIDAASISNRAGTILSALDAHVTSAGQFDNTQGTLQAAGSLALDAAGTMRNDAGVVEALANAGTLAVHAGALDNGAGRIVNVGSGATAVNVDGTLTSRGLIAGNGQVDMAAADIDNQAGGTIAAGGVLALAASHSLANAGGISSHGTLTVDAAAAAVRNSGQIVSGADATLDTGTFDNSGGQLVTVQGSGGDVTLRSGDIANVGGTIVADGAATIAASGALDSRQGTIRSADALALSAAGALGNQNGAIETAAGPLTVAAQSIDNTAGRLVNAGTGSTRVQAATSIVNSGTLAGNGMLDVQAATLRNDAGGTVAAGAAMDLRVTDAFTNAGTVSAAGTLTLDQAGTRIANSGRIAAGDDILLRGASIANDGGQIAALGTGDVTLDSGSTLSNRAGAIAASGDATLTAHGAFDNSQGQVQTPGRLAVSADGALTNTGGALEAIGAGSMLAVQAQSITSSGRIVNAGTGTTTVTGATSIVNSGTLAGNGAVDITAATLQNKAGGTLSAGGPLELAVRQQLDNQGTISSGATLRFQQAGAAFNNAGRIGTGGAIDITAASINNNGGQLYTVTNSAAAIALDAGSLSNQGGTIAADGRLTADIGGAIGNGGGTLHGGRDVVVDAGGTLTNGSGTIESGAGTLDVTAQGITSSGRIVNAGTGTTTIDSRGAIVNSGTIAGNGDVTVHAQTLQNQGPGQLASARDLLLDVNQQLANTGAISSGGTLTFDEAGASFTNGGQVAAGGKATFTAASFNNDGGRISTVKGSGSDIVVTAPGMSNRGGAILADGNATFTLNGAADNRQGTLQAGRDLALTAAGAVTNDAGTIETLGALATLTVDGATIDNGSGRISNAGTGATKVVSKDAIVNNGTIAAMGDLLLSGRTLQNGAAGTIASGRNMDLAITQQLTNQGKVNSNGTLTFNQAGATFTNSGQIVAAGNALITAQQVNNDGGKLGTAAGSGADLALTSQQLSNQGGRVATDRDLTVSTHTVAGMGELFGGRDLALTMDGDYVQANGTQQFHSNRDLSLTVTGNITNTSTFEAARNLTLSGQQFTNQAGATIEAQGVTLKAAGNLANAGEINGATQLDISAANVTNTSGIVGGNVTVTTGNLDNTGAQALVGATGAMTLNVAGTLNNTGGATLYSSGDMAISGGNGAASGLVNNNSSTIEAGGNLSLAAGTLNNVRENVQIVKVQTVDETRQMALPSWYHQGDNHSYFDANSSNYQPHEVYFVNPNDILEEKQYVTPDGYLIYRAVIRTHANDSAFLVGGSSLYSSYGTRQRLTTQDGTRVIYYRDRGEMANPDQGGPSSNAYAYTDQVTSWNSTLTFSNQYGSCSANCIRLVTQPDYTDPTSTIIRDFVKALAPAAGKLEVSRVAHHTVVEDRIAPGSGAVAQILSGDGMHLTVNNVIDNRYGDIKARGALTIDGGAAISNTGATLYATHTFDGTWKTGAGDVTAYTHPSISVEIGSAAGVIEGGQGVSITGRSFANINVTAGSVGNIRESVTVIGSGASGASSAGAHASASGSTGGAAGGSISGSGSANHGGLAGMIQAMAAGAQLSAAGQAGASGIGNGMQAGGTAGGSGYGNGAGVAGDAAASGVANGAAAGGAVSASGAVNAGRMGAQVAAGANGTLLGDVGTNAGPSVRQAALGVQGAAIGNVRQVSASGLFIRNPNANGNYVFEARPQFANQGQWTSSDYLLNQLALDPATTQKRLGDGFYEQRLVREQLSELTGRTMQSGASDDSVYKQLLTNAVSAAQEFNLRPGVALSADQVSRLTSDIVWMESETVQLPDGTTETVLVPKVYLAHVGDKALQPSGALVTGAGVSITTTESIVNSGGMIDGGNGRTVLVAGQDIVNRGGTIAGGDVELHATRDVKNETLAVTQNYGSSNTSGSYTTLSNLGTITATGALTIGAKGDFTDLAGKITAGSATIGANGNVSFDAIKLGSTYQSQVSGYTENDSTITHQLSQLSTGGDLTLTALGNLNLTGTQVSVGTSGKGAAVLGAGGAVNIAAVTNEVNTSVMNDPSSKQYDKQVHSNETVVGAGVAAAGDLTVQAGVKGNADLNVTASVLAGGGSVLLKASNDVNIASATESHLSDTAIHRESSSAIKKSSSSATDYSASTLAVGSSISGNNVTVSADNDIAIGGSSLRAQEALMLGAKRDLIVTTATSTGSEKHTSEEKKSGFSLGSDGAIGYSKGQQKQNSSGDTVTQVGSVLNGGTVTTTSGRDTLIKGSTVVADGDVAIAAGRDLAIVSAENTSSEESASSSKKSGSIGTFFQPAIGSVKTTQDGTRDQVTQVGSQVASLGGNVTLDAGNKYTQTSSAVNAAGDIGIVAKDVLINAAMDSGTSTDHNTFSKTAIGGSVSIPVVEAVKGVKSAIDAGKDAGDSRMKALAAMNAAKGAMDAVNSGQELMSGDITGIKVSVSLGSTKSESNTEQRQQSAVGSTVTADGNVSIVATGGGADSNLTAIGAEIKAGQEVALAADNDVNLLAAENMSSQHSKNSSSGKSVGIGLAIGGQQDGFTLDIGVSKGRGKADGEDVTYTNTHVNGNSVTVSSGADTTLKGGVITANTVKADVGGDLNIESLQDKSTYDSKQVNAGVNVSLCIPPFCYGVSTVGGNFSKAKVDGDYLSVVEQSGIRAGDGGFQLTVGGNTDLKGGVISSSQTAVDQGINSLTTGSLTFSDLVNKDTFNASGFAMSGTVAGLLGEQSQPGTQGSEDESEPDTSPSATAGFGHAKGNQQSLTQSAISGGTITIKDPAKQSQTGTDVEAALAGLNRAVTTENSAEQAGALKQAWDGAQLQSDVQNQIQITQTFSKEAPKAIAKYADDRIKELNKTLETEADPAKQLELKAEIAKWDEGGAYRVALHTVSGGLSGGLGGALGAGAVASSADLLDELQTRTWLSLVQQGVSPETASMMSQGVAELTSLAVGAAAGGYAGAGTALTTDTNNRQLTFSAFNRLRAGCKESRSAECATINRMAGVRSSMPMSDPALVEGKVVLNYDGEGKIVSYVVLAKDNQPSMIMEPLEYAAFRNAPKGIQALSVLSPQYSLDFASSGLYAVAGADGRAWDQFVAGITSFDYARDLALGALSTAVSLPRAVPGTTVMPGSGNPVPITVISPEIETKILYGQQQVKNGKPNSTLIGAHSGEIDNAHPAYAVEVLAEYPDGTSSVKIVTQFADGTLSKIKTSTLFPESWSPAKIIDSVQQAGSTKALATRASDGASLYQATIGGVKVEVIKVGNKVTAGYPCGKACTDPAKF